MIAIILTLFVTSLYLIINTSKRRHQNRQVHRGLIQLTPRIIDSTYLLKTRVQTRDVFDGVDEKSDIWTRKRDAIVSLLIEIQPKIFARGTGFFIHNSEKSGYIVSAGHNVLNLLDFDRDEIDGNSGWCSRYLLCGGCTRRGSSSSSSMDDSDSKDVTAEELLNKKQSKLYPKRVVSITATVTRVNGTDQVKAMPCHIVGVFGAADIAVLYIEGITNKHTHLNWSSLSSRSITPDTDCFVIGDTLGENIQSCTRGVVRCNTWFDASGQQAVESMLVDALGYAGNSGSPILNLKGEVIGVFTFGVEGASGMGGGVAQAIGKPIADSLINWFNVNHRQSKMNAKIMNTNNAETQQVDKFGNVIMPYYGITWRAYTTLERVRLGNISDEIEGAVIVKTDKITISALKVDDIVTEIDGVKIGNVAGRLPPSSAIWTRRNPGDTIKIRYKRGQYNTNWASYETTAVLGSFPIEKSFPLGFYT